MLNHSEYKNLLVHKYNALSRKAFNAVRHFAPEEQYYGQEIMAALKRLKDVVQIKLHDTNWKNKCYPLGIYNLAAIDAYDMSNESAMENIRIATLTDNQGEKQFLEHPSLADALRSLAKKIAVDVLFKTLKKSIEQDIQSLQTLSQKNYDYCAEIQSALERLRQFIIVFNQGPGWRGLCLPDGNILLEAETIQGWDLSTQDAMFAMSIPTYRAHNPSLYLLFAPIYRTECAKYLFNQIYERVMPEVYHLQELADRETQPIVVGLLNDRASLIANTLEALYKTTANYSVNFGGRTNTNLSTISQMCAIKFNLKTSNLSLLEAISYNDGLKLPERLQALPATLERISISTRFHRQPGEIIALHTGMQTSIVVARTLCQLTEAGDLEQIKALNPSAQNIDFFVEAPIQFKLSTLSSDLLYSSQRFPSVYAGRYNALILAVLYRETQIVHYLLEKGANPKLKGGRKNDVSAEGCLDIQLPGMKPVPRELAALFSTPNRGNFGKHHNLYQPSQCLEPSYVILDTKNSTDETPQQENPSCIIC